MLCCHFRMYICLKDNRGFQEYRRSWCFISQFGCLGSLQVSPPHNDLSVFEKYFYRNLYINIIMHLITLFLIVSMLTMNCVFFASLRYGTQLYSFSITFLTIILPYFINLLMELQYCHYLNILRIRYKLLNEYLETLVQETKTHSGKHKTLWIT